MFSHRKTGSLAVPGSSIPFPTITKEADSVLQQDVVIPASTNDVNVDAAFPVDARLKSFIIKTDQDVTVYTNDTSGGTPDATLAVKATRQYDWDDDSYDTFLLAGADVTTLYFDNAGSDDASVQIQALYDGTP